MDSVSASIRHDQGYIEGLTGCIPIGIAKTVNAGECGECGKVGPEMPGKPGFCKACKKEGWSTTPESRPSSADKERLGKWFCRDFKAQVYITEAALKSYPDLEPVLEALVGEYELVKSVPEIEPYERCLEWVVKITPEK